MIGARKLYQGSMSVFGMLSCLLRSRFSSGGVLSGSVCGFVFHSFAKLHCLNGGYTCRLVPVRLNLNVASIHLHFSPTRYARIMTIANSLFDLSTAASNAQSVLTQPEAASMHGGVSVLAWEGLGGRTPFWRKRYATVHGGNLYISENEITLDIVKSVWLLGDVYVSTIPPSLVWGKRNVVAIVPLGVDLKSGVEMATSTILRLDSEEKAQNWRLALIQEKERMAAATGIVETPIGRCWLLALAHSAYPHILGVCIKRSTRILLRNCALHLK